MRLRSKIFSNFLLYIYILIYIFIYIYIYIDFLLNAENQDFKEKLGKEKYEKKLKEYNLEE